MPPTPFPPFDEDSLFIAQHKVLHYPIRRRFEDLIDNEEVTFLLSKCQTPTNGENVKDLCRHQISSGDDWLYFNYRNLALEGIAPSSGAASFVFNLTGFTKTQARSFILRIRVAPAKKNPQVSNRNHEFCLHLRPKQIEVEDDEISISKLRMREQVQVVRVLSGLEQSEMTIGDVAVLSVGYGKV